MRGYIDAFEDGRDLALERIVKGIPSNEIYETAEHRRRIFDRESVGWFFYQGMMAAATKRTPSEQAYYDSYDLFSFGHG